MPVQLRSYYYSDQTQPRGQQQTLFTTPQLVRSQVCSWQSIDGLRAELLQSTFVERKSESLNWRFSLEAYTGEKCLESAFLLAWFFTDVLGCTCSFLTFILAFSDQFLRSCLFSWFYLSCPFDSGPRFSLPAFTVLDNRGHCTVSISVTETAVIGHYRILFGRPPLLAVTERLVLLSVLSLPLCDPCH